MIYYVTIITCLVIVQETKEKEKKQKWKLNQWKEIKGKENQNKI